MVRSKEARSTIKWSDKARLYLERVGLLDGRSGRVKNADFSMSLNRFVNEAVVFVLEQGCSSVSYLASPDDLRNAYALFRYRLAGREIQRLMNERLKFEAMMTEDFRVTKL